MEKGIRRFGFFFFFVLLLTISCQKEKSPVIETIEGVQVIHNPKELVPQKGQPSKITFEEELTIGEANGREEYMFSIIRGVAVDDQSRMYIVDYRHANVRVYDVSGEYLFTIGKEGQGPDEFSRPSGVSITTENFLVVDDSGNKTIKYFTLDGNYVKSFSTAKIRMYARTIVSKQGYVLGLGTDIDPQNPVYEIRKFDENFQFQKIIRTCPTPSPGKINPFHPVFYFQIDRDDNIVYGFPETYEIQVLNPEGEIIRRMLKDYDPVEISEEEKEEASKEYPEDFRIEFLKHYPPFRTFSVDDEGRIIVQAWARHEEKLRFVYDVFDPEGFYVAKFYLEARPLLWKKGKMYALAEDEEGFQSIKRYTVIWE
ncbi:MAG: 6-bladed beta-propeller [Candidatus Aminicenantes bacterium]|nr:6-bladed beta-propeller [Candidatus Aminicenantes bacterium]